MNVSKRIQSELKERRTHVQRLQKEIVALELELEACERAVGETRAVTLTWSAFKAIVNQSQKAWKQVPHDETGWRDFVCDTMRDYHEPEIWQEIYRLRSLDGIEWYLCDSCMETTGLGYERMDSFEYPSSHEPEKVRMDAADIEPDLLKEVQ